MLVWCSGWVVLCAGMRYRKVVLEAGTKRKCNKNNRGRQRGVVKKCARVKLLVQVRCVGHTGCLSCVIQGECFVTKSWAISTRRGGN